MTTPALTQEQIDALLNTMTYDTREAGSPLREFTARCVAIEPTQEVRSGFDGNSRNVLKLAYKFTELNVIESLTPYPWATGELVFYNNDPSNQPSATSPYGIWAQSITDILGSGTKLPQVRGKMVHVKWGPAQRGRYDPETKKFEEYAGEAFKIISVDGKSSTIAYGQGQAVATTSTVPIEDLLADLANGRQREGADGFAAEALKNEVIKVDKPTFNDIVGDNGISVLAKLVASGKLVLDGETFRKPTVA